MAAGNYREYLKEEIVKAKKYFYVLRPLLACRWILEKRTPPPMLFSELMAAELPDALHSPVKELLRIKMEVPELNLIPKVNAINTYIEDELVNIKGEIDGLPPLLKRGYDELNQLFLRYVW